MADAKMLNLAKIKARLAKIPQAVQHAAAAQLKTEVDDMVDAMKRAAPVDPASPDPGALRDSIHEYENPGRPLSYFILADAKDAEGRFIGQHVEFGHRAENGSHVPASPSFFPTYRARKKGMRSRMRAATKAAVKREFPE